jgi:hypothetical protein
MNFKIEGVDEMRRKVAALADRMPMELGRALKEEVDAIAAEAKKQTPVATGKLRDSVRVEGPVVDGDRISAAVVAGGPDVDYAIQVHEDLDAKHDDGTAKFIERPLMDGARDLMEGVAKRIDLNLRGKG